MLDRVRPAKTLNQIVVATTTESRDDAVETLCKTLGVGCFRGSEDDVLDRFYQAATHFKATHVLRLTADCPLHDYEVIDRLVSTFFEASADYAANALEHTYPDGFDAEVFTYEALKRAHTEAKKPSEREHVTPYINQHRDLFKIVNVAHHRDASNMRLTLDEPSDFKLIATVVNALFTPDRFVHLDEIIDYLEANPDLLAINGSIPRNEGYLKSLKKDLEQLS